VPNRLVDPPRLGQGDVAVVKIGIYVPISAFIDLNFKRTPDFGSRLFVTNMRKSFGPATPPAKSESFNLAINSQKLDGKFLTNVIVLLFCLMKRE
jgi:hypothetical protein